MIQVETGAKAPIIENQLTHTTGKPKETHGKEADLPLSELSNRLHMAVVRMRDLDDPSISTIQRSAYIDMLDGINTSLQVNFGDAKVGQPLTIVPESSNRVAYWIGADLAGVSDGEFIVDPETGYTKPLPGGLELHASVTAQHKFSSDAIHVEVRQRSDHN